MKKLSAVLALMLVLVMTLSMNVSAGPDGIIENPEIKVYYQSPTVDGNIDPSEGWSTAALMNAETLGYFWAHNPLTSDGNVFYAVDNEGIYVAGKIVEGLSAVDMSGIDVTGLNQFNYSTGPDDLDPAEDGTNQYGWNGDVFGVMFDPLGAFINEGFVTNSDVSAWYLVGLFEGDVARVYRTHTITPENNCEITDQVEVAGKKLSDGWCFEMKISWDMIIADTYDSSMGYIELTKDVILKTGATIRTGALYQDRFFDEEQGSVQTWGRYITAPTTLPDGNPGHMGTGENIASYGIKLVLDEMPVVDDGNGEGEGNGAGEGNGTGEGTGEGTGTGTGTGNGTGTNNGGTNNGSTNTTNKGNTTSGNKKPATGTTTGGNAAQTSDVALLVSLCALVTSGTGIAIAKKRR